MSNNRTTQPRMTQSHVGTLVIISSPSGGGKTSICRKLLSRSRRRQGWTFSVSYTTRSKRVGERNGREYFFVDDNEFAQRARRGFFAEHFKVHLYKYGTPREPLESVRKRGGVLLLDVDVHGALRIKRDFREAITIFVLPPSIAALRQRLRQRGTETPEQLRIRFENAKGEMRLYHKFDYIVINQDVETAVQDVLSIVRAHGTRRENISKEQIRKIIG